MKVESTDRQLWERKTKVP